MQRPQRRRRSACLIQCSCSTKGLTHGWTCRIYIIKTLGKNAKFVWSDVCRQNRWEHRKTDSHTHTQTQTHTAHCSTSWICMPVRPQSRGDNKSHFRHVCQVLRRHLSSGWMRWVGSEQSKQGHRYPCMIRSTTPHQLPKKKKNISRTGQSTWESYSVLAPRLSLSECNLTSPKTINNLSVFQSIIHFSAVQRAHDGNNSCHQQLVKYDGVGDVV